MGKRAEGARLERMQASPRWRDGGFRNLHPITPGLRDPAVPMPSLSDFLWGGERRVPEHPLLADEGAAIAMVVTAVALFLTGGVPLVLRRLAEREGA